MRKYHVSVSDIFEKYLMQLCSHLRPTRIFIGLFHLASFTSHLKYVFVWGEFWCWSWNLKTLVLISLTSSNRTSCSLTAVFFFYRRPGVTTNNIVVLIRPSGSFFHDDIPCEGIYVIFEVDDDGTMCRYKIRMLSTKHDVATAKAQKFSFQL